MERSDGTVCVSASDCLRRDLSPRGRIQGIGKLEAHQGDSFGGIPLAAPRQRTLRFGDTVDQYALTSARR